jgi:lysozyme
MLTFMDDLNAAIFYTKRHIQVFDHLSENRQRILINMMFNLGPNRFAGFKNMIRAIHNFDYERAYMEMLDSKWAKVDVPNRARNLSERWRMG